MNVQELEAQLRARIKGLEDEESQLREELESLRRLPQIADEWRFDLSSVLRGGPQETLQEAVSSEDPFETLRRRLTQVQPAFNSRTLFAASA